MEYRTPLLPGRQGLQECMYEFSLHSTSGCLDLSRSPDVARVFSFSFILFLFL